MSEIGTIAGANGFLELSGEVTCGPETAARLGVPVGTVVNLGVLASTDPPTDSGADPLAVHLRGEG